MRKLRIVIDESSNPTINDVPNPTANPETGLFNQDMNQEKKTAPKINKLWNVLITMFPYFKTSKARKDANDIHKQLIEMGVEWFELEAGFKNYKQQFTDNPKLNWAPSIRGLIKYWSETKPTESQCLECLYIGWQHRDAYWIKKLPNRVGFYTFLNIEGHNKRTPSALLDESRRLYTRFISVHGDQDDNNAMVAAVVRSEEGATP